MPNAVIIGASSGVGEALARRLARQGWRLGLAARRTELLARLCADLGDGHAYLPLDVSNTEAAVPAVERFFEEFGGVELVVLCAGTGHINEDAEWAPDRNTLEVNVLGFAAMAQAAMRHFLRRGSGHLVGISSIAALRGSGPGAAYAASKAFESLYLDGLRDLAKRKKAPITVTEILPGFVNTAMMKADRPFWVASPDKAAEQIARAIQRRVKRAYVTRRWALIGLLLRLLPR